MRLRACSENAARVVWGIFRQIDPNQIVLLGHNAYIIPQYGLLKPGGLIWNLNKTSWFIHLNIVNLVEQSSNQLVLYGNWVPVEPS